MFTDGFNEKLEYRSSIAFFTRHRSLNESPRSSIMMPFSGAFMTSSDIPALFRPLHFVGMKTANSPTFPTGARGLLNMNE